MPMSSRSTLLEDLFGPRPPKPDLSRFRDLMVDGRRDPSKFLETPKPVTPAGGLDGTSQETPTEGSPSRLPLVQIAQGERQQGPRSDADAARASGSRE